MKSRRLTRLFVGITLLCGATLCAQQQAGVTSSHPPLRIVLAGDSTVCNYKPEHSNRGWGQFLAEEFKPGEVVVVNLAAQGRSTKSFIHQRLWEKALAEKPDIVLIQFGHNDSHDSRRPEATDPATDYRANIRRYIDEARAIGAVPILVTPMVRRTFDASGRIEEKAYKDEGHSLASYADAMKEVAGEKKVPVVDLYSSSKALAEKLGPSAEDAFANKQGDITHFNEKGARAMLALIMEQLPDTDPRLKAALKNQ